MNDRRRGIRRQALDDTAFADRHSMGSELKALLFNRSEGRLRVWLRLVLHALALILSAALASWVAVAAGADMVLIRGVIALVVLAVTLMSALHLDHRPPAELGLRLRPGYALDVGYGVAVGSAAIALIAIIEERTGWADYQRETIEFGPRVEALVQLMLFFASVSLSEEVVSRGYHLRNLSEAFSWLGRPRVAAAAAVALSSLIFGAIHAGNPEVSPLAIANIAFGGVLLATGALTQGDLAIPLGVHFGWNTAQALLGMPVSGIRLWHASALYVRTELGPDLVTGGPFGPEAGLEGLLGMSFGIVMTLAWAKVRGGWRSEQARYGTPYLLPR